MDWMTFIVELVKALAWPAAVVISVILFRKPIYQLIPFLKKLKWKDFELEFSREVAELRKESDKALPTKKDQISLVKESASRFLQLAHISPRSAVLEAWGEVESAAIDSIRRHELAPDDMLLRSHSRVGHALLHADIIDKEQFEILHKLRELRNKAAHAEDFSFAVDDAQDYILSALRLAVFLRKK